VTGPARAALGLVAGGAYVFGLGLAAISVVLAVRIGPLDAFAVQMIAGAAIVAVVGVAAFAWLAGPTRRTLVALVVGSGVVLSVATALLMLLMAPLFAP